MRNMLIALFFLYFIAPAHAAVQPYQMRGNNLPTNPI